ncbi:hypothetical protein ACFO5R_14845 [Halosolutus amylolyticus]|uniref:DUF4382 domain-containing protein n=1 Tax=Halosolutus amylolyticus TaxID=2932267 RepID=A0ABD5PRM7_9EURY|nr:hypothetical protein [Halosolutus amylolyticus]
MPLPAGNRTRRRVVRTIGGTLTGTVLAGCQGLRSNGTASDESSPNADDESQTKGTDAGPDDTEPTDDGNCDPSQSTVTAPDGDAAVSLTLRESIGYGVPPAEVTVQFSRVEFDGADVPTVAYEVDERLDLWAAGTDGSDREFAVVDREPIPVGTYRGIRVYGTIVDVEPTDETVETVRLAEGDHVADTFGTVFESDDRKEFTAIVRATDTGEAFELDFNRRTTSSW